MTNKTYEIIQTPAEYVVKALEAFVQIMVIIEICTLLLVVAFLAIAGWSCYCEFKEDGRSPVNSEGREQEGEIIQIARWSDDRLEIR